MRQVFEIPACAGMMVLLCTQWYLMTWFRSVNGLLNQIFWRKFMIKGHCNCQDVTFEITTEVTDVYVCHCSICRRATGSNGIAVIVVNNDDFAWSSGKELVKTWDKPDHDWQTSFCHTCGSTLPGANDSERMYVPAGLIMQGDEKLKVAHHIFVDSKASWDEIGDDGKQHKCAFGQ